MSATEPTTADPAWDRLRRDAQAIVKAEPLLTDLARGAILQHNTLEQALAALLADKLASHHLPTWVLTKIFAEPLSTSADLADAVRRDLQAVRERDPAARSLAVPFLYFKGFQALQAYRVAHWLWNEGRKPLALCLQSRISEAFAVDIHPAARIGKGILIDHGTSVVIGETAVVGDDVSILHEVTLGGTGKDTGDRHPKIGHGVLIGAGAKILGNIRIGDGSKIAAGSVVLSSVPDHSTVAGIPAKVVGTPRTNKPALQMDQIVEFDYCI